MNLICNAAANGVPTNNAWLIVTGEPCMMCSKLIHHAGIERVVIVDGGFMGENGVSYLEDHGVEIQRTEGPKDLAAKPQRLTIGLWLLAPGNGLFQQEFNLSVDGAEIVFRPRTKIIVKRGINAKEDALFFHLDRRTCGPSPLPDRSVGSPMPMPPGNHH